MILSASINLFDGHELLSPLVRSLRPATDHISVVYQSRSYWGEQADDDLNHAVAALQNEGLVDDVARCDAEVATGEAAAKQHESRKRTLGLELAKQAGATHCLSLDVDEFYRPDELRRARQLVDAHGYDFTACKFYDYHSRPIYRCRQMGNYFGIDLYVPVIVEVTDRATFGGLSEFFCPVDPSRRMACENPAIFPPEIVVMHHMTTVRASTASLASKFTNSSSRPVVAIECPRALAERVWEFDPRTDAAPAVTIVNDEFGLSKYTRRTMN